LALVLRELLGLASNLKEAKTILNQRSVLVDGLVRTDKGFPVGLFDLVALPEKKESYRALFDGKGRVRLVAVEPKTSHKIAKVVGKTAAPKGLIELRLHDGKVLTVKKTGLKVGDSVKISLPDQKVVEEVPLAKGQLVYIVSGKHVNERAKIKEIFPGTIARGRIVTLEEKDKTFQTTEKSLVVVGKEKPLVELEAEGKK
jgi:small subunit ribosomal protein S4e